MEAGVLKDEGWEALEVRDHERDAEPEAAVAVHNNNHHEFTNKIKRKEKCSYSRQKSPINVEQKKHDSK